MTEKQPQDQTAPEVTALMDEDLDKAVGGARKLPTTKRTGDPCAGGE